VVCTPVGSEPLKKIIFETVALKKGMENSLFFFGQRGKAKECTDCLESTYFHLSFPKGVEHAPGHVITPTFCANKMLRGFEHAHLSKEAKGKFEHFLGQTHLRSGEKRSRETKLKPFFRCTCSRGSGANF
jgi:hypothetical protein